MGINMLTDTELDVFKAMLSNPFKEWYFADLMRTSKQNSRNTVQRTLKRLRSEGLVKETTLGNLKQIRLRLQDDVVSNYVGLAAIQSLPKPARLALSELRTAVDKHTALFSIVVFGSYAKGKQRPDSDIDVAVIVPKSKEYGKLQGFLEHDTQYSPVPLHIQVIPEDEMIEMLTTKEQNVGKQIVEKHLTIHNPAIFYDIVQRAEHGFTSNIVP
jgi:predicted nucleotidyltransferase